MLLCAASMLMGCLVTDKIDFEGVEDSPPVILDKPGTNFHIGDVIRIDLDSEKNEWTFPVVVRDDNVDDDLKARLRVRTRDNQTPPFTPDQVVQSTGTANREFTVTIPRAPLKQDQCHRVELAVSGSFLDSEDPALFAYASPRDDLAIASWLVWEGKADPTPEQALAIVTTCETVNTFLDETEVAEAPP